LLTTYESIKATVTELLPELEATQYPEDLLNEYAQGEVPIYTSEIQTEWVELEFDDQNCWQDCFSLSDLSKDTDITYLMTIDLVIYYEALFSRAYDELTKGEDNA
jgi:hypothetical protein